MDYTQQILRLGEAQHIPLLTQAVLKVKQRRSSLLSALLLLALILFSPVSYATQDYKLSDTLVLNGDVNSYQISPDGNWAVYQADQDTDDVFELYSVALAGGTAPVKLNGTLVAGGDVFTGFVISPDSSRVVYRADPDTDGVTELYSVPMAGGTPPVKLNGMLVADGDVNSGFVISPDSSRVVYQADQDTDQVLNLYSVPVAGGTPVKLNGMLVADGDVISGFTISPDSSRVVYRADQTTNDVVELYSVPLTGGISDKLNGMLVANGGVISGFAISPDSSRVVYRAVQDTNFVTELYSVPVVGGSSVKLNGMLVADGDVNSGFTISPDSSRVVYRADQTTNDVFELYSVPLTGGISDKLNGMLVAGGDVFSGFVISPDSSRVVYRADQTTNDVFELYSVPTTGGASVKLNDTLVAGGDVFSEFVISPDSSRVVYRADQDTDGVNELYSVPIIGGTSVTLNDTLVAGGDVFSEFAISADISRVVYRADQDTDSVTELYSVPVTGGTPLKLNGTLVADGDVSLGFVISPDSSRVVYQADQDTVFVNELYGALLPINSFPYTESFENGPADWIPDGTLWELGTPANTVIIGASKGVNAWVTDLDANYPNGAFEAVVSPIFDFSGFIELQPTISMDVWWQSENSWDGAVLQSTIDGGTSWVDVGTNGDPNNWFNDDTINGLSVNGESGHGWTGRDGTGSGAYVRASHALTGLAGQASVQLRVLFGSDVNTNDNGFAFDNVYIGGPDFDGDGDPDITDPDDDNDGLTDVYEKLHGLNQFDASDAGLDPDMDGLTTLEEFNINTNLDPNDPDTDGDGIDDGLDPVPLISSNKCTAGTMSGPLFVDATLMETISDDFSCGAINSITVQPTIILSSGSLILIAPTVIFEPGFNASGELRVISEDPCANCGP